MVLSEIDKTFTAESAYAIASNSEKRLDSEQLQTIIKLVTELAAQGEYELAFGQTIRSNVKNELIKRGFVMSVYSPNKILWGKIT